MLFSKMVEAHQKRAVRLSLCGPLWFSLNLLVIVPNQIALKSEPGLPAQVRCGPFCPSPDIRYWLYHRLPHGPRVFGGQ
jgi:hypothetical protein